jgi:hypothetical protein
MVKKVEGDVLEEGSNKKKKYTTAIMAGFFTPKVEI